MEYEEHEKRAWSVDFSRTEPTQLVSGSDDCKVLVSLHFSLRNYLNHQRFLWVWTWRILYYEFMTLVFSCN